MNSEYASQVQTVKRRHFRDFMFKDQRTELSLSDLQIKQKRGPAVHRGVKFAKNSSVQT